MVQIATGNSSFFFNDTATTEIYTLSLHDALPISTISGNSFSRNPTGILTAAASTATITNNSFTTSRAEEHTTLHPALPYILCRNLAAEAGINGALVQSGTLSGNATWGQVSMPYVV